ncbi:replicative helicase loader/inhibitor [Paenibacillus bouchesdurhonensis]|uniref:replicative helicase loader/inhibitor n=1 Tax=Paenibacillus bouchesdurhonensis TaxID=1870990 RepID=UPI0018FF3210|nr:replicative helicase loader/inhibitor [Paenibacillus bouchesdurhonensis]
MKQTETANFLAMIKTAYPFFEITEPGTRLWHMMLQDIDFKTAQVRLADHIRTSKFAPTISEIVQAPEEKPSYYDLLRQEEQQEQLALEAYNEKAVPMPDHIRERLERRAKRKVNSYEP